MVRDPAFHRLPVVIRLQINSQPVTHVNSGWRYVHIRPEPEILAFHLITAGLMAVAAVSSSNGRRQEAHLPE